MYESTKDQDKHYQHHQKDQYPNTGGDPNNLLKNFKKVEKK